MPRYWTPVIAVFVILSAVGCSDDSTSAISCDEDQLYDQLNQECVPRAPLTTADGGDVDQDVDQQDADSFSNDDGGADTTDTTETEDAADAEDAIDLEACDKDRDQSIAESCGGYDCDDNDSTRSPEFPEFCDQIDNNCSGVVNDNVTCTFYAHAGTELYEIDPFAKEATKLGSDLPYLQDIDTHPDGTLFGVNEDGIHRFDPWADAWVLQGGFGSVTINDPNGLSIDSTGTAFITAQDKMYQAELMSGRATLLGRTGNFYSSGDCVVNKRDTLFMTSKEEGQSDKLVQVSRETGQGTALGEVGFEKVFALTAAWGKLYGLTSNGELIEINQQDGNATLVHTFNGISFWGAASTPNR
jgi:hypothetical protein